MTVGELIPTGIWKLNRTITIAAAASGGAGIGNLLRKSMGALKTEIDSARDKTTEGLTICPTHDGVAVQ